MYLAGFLLGRATRQITFDAMNEAEEARRKVGQRDALLREARQDLDHALMQVGGPGHYTEQKIGSFVLGIVIGRGAMAEVYEAQNIEKEIRGTVTKFIGPIAKPDMIQVVSGLPKTRSGKIMRRILRKIGEGEATNLGDTSTLLDPGVVEEIIAGAKVEVKR